MKSRNKLIIGLILIFFIGLSLAQTFVHLLTQAWWFESVDFSDVFWTRLTWQIVIWVGSFALYALFLAGNYGLALHLTRKHSFRFLEGTDLEPYTRSFANSIAGIVIFLIALNAAENSVSAWETVLKYFNATNFQIEEPIYRQDVGFYLFKLPLYEGIHDWLIALVIFGLILSLAVYILKSNFRNLSRWDTLLSHGVKTHISLQIAAVSVLVAFGFWLGRYELLYESDGLVYGAGYTDVNARIFAYWVMSILAICLAALSIFSIWRNSLALPLYGIAIYALAFVGVNEIYPGFVQKIVVNPNELEKERPYIEHNIKLTRSAYQLAGVQRQDFPAETQLDSQALEDNEATIRNIRLWDYRPLLSTYRQLQEIRLYYRFNDVDIDRYTLDGNYRQVMLAPRELVYEQLAEKAKTWVNKRLKYTHGYGLVMSPVNRVTSDGLPVLFIKNIPPVSEVDLEITEPAIYYGEKTDNYIFTGMGTPEFDYPRSGENAFTTYDGKGGVPLPSIWQRLAYAYDLSSLNILISGYFTPESRIHYYRNIVERVNQVAPFLRFDGDPYISVVDGKLQWIIDAYTVSERYPYSEPILESENVGSILDSESLRQIARGEVNYIRNSVKVAVDAFDGTMRFFVVDETDPVLTTYRKIFPKLFIPKDSIPENIKDNFRYPADLFTIQAQMYLSYHMSDPQIFYNQEDLWRFPTEVYEGNKRLMEPYYLILRLPEGEGEEFVLILPFTPVNKDNMIAWMAARSDGENYGKLLLYEFPKQKLVYGPSQIEARIDQNPDISQQLTLWSQEGSKVIRGDLLVIPIDDSLLYVEPVYLRAEQGELPELKRVIVAYGKEVVMRENLEQSLAAIFGEIEQPARQQPAQPVSQPQPTISEDITDLTEAAIEAYQNAEAARRQENWAEYGQYKQEFERILRQLEQKTGQ